MDPSSMDVVGLQTSLYHSTQQGHWEEALVTFKNHPGIHKTAINSSGDTLLHVAVNDANEQSVEEIVDEIKKNQSWSALETRNDREDTPLHCAASRGSLKMCVAIVEAQGSDTKLSEARNKEGETPLYLAALHGHKDAFFYLHSCCLDRYSRPWRRSSDGETVLHCTIRREHFDLAFQTILLYKRDIVGSVDEKGITPLHILANKPAAFEKSSNFRWYNKLVYNCIIVKPLMESLEQQLNNNNTLLNWPIKFSSQKTQTGGDAENPGYVGYNNVAPPNYWTCYDILVRLFICFIQPVVRTLGLQDIEDLKKKKQKHVWCRQILDEIWKHKYVAYVGGGSAFRGYSLLQTIKDLPKPGSHHQIGAVQGGSENETVKATDDGNQNQQKAWGEKQKNSDAYMREPALFVAARNGVLEIVKKILRDIPEAIHETNSQDQNVLHVAVECRQPYVIYEILTKKSRLSDDLIHSLDKDGNSILHMVAKSKFQTQGSGALEMQHEIKWYEYVRSLVPSYVTLLSNYEGETPEDIFLRDHKDLVQKSDEWLCRTSESCSVVAALVAGVAFATSSTVPGGNDDKTGRPTLEGHPGFDLFAISALIALCFSVTALILFLSILTSRKHPADFMKKLPVKLFLAISSLFVSIFSMFISFCAAHSFVLEGKSMKSVLLLYAIICLPVSFTIVEFPLYMDLFRGIFMKVQPPYSWFIQK